MTRFRGFSMVLVVLWVGGLSLESVAQSSFWRKVGGPGGAYVSTFAQTANGDVLAATFKGVFRSTDGGQDWKALGGALENAEVWSLVVHPDGDLFAGTSDGIYRSSDDGASWHAVVTDTHVGALVVNADGVLFAGAFRDMLRSEDGGDTWHAVNTGLDAIRERSKKLAITEEGVLFVGAYAEGVYRSSDNGAHWEAVNTGLMDLAVRVLYVSPAGDLLLGMNHGGVYRSQDNGTSWQAINSGLPSVDVRALLVTADGDLFAGAYAGSDEEGTGGIYRSTDDGQNWEAVDIGQEDVDVRSLSMIASGDLYAGSAGGAVYHSEDQGERWQAFTMGFNHTLVIELFTARNGDVYAGTMRGGLHRSRDEGVSWQALTNGLTSKTIGYLAESPAGDLVAQAGSGVFFSGDHGDTWQSIADNLQTEYGFTEVGFTPAGTILVGDYEGAIHRTEDQGATWSTTGVQIANTPSHYSSGNVWDFVFNDQGDIFTAAYGGGAFRSQDDGKTWQAINKGVTNLQADKLARNVNGDLYMSADASIFRSQDDGANWTDISAGLSPDVVVTKSYAFSAEGDVYAVSFIGRYYEERILYHLAPEAARWVEISTGIDRLNALTLSPGGYLYAGTFGDGIYRSEEPMASEQTTAVASGGDGVPEAFALAQNYPNPFNPTTAITFDLSSESTLTLTIYNALGQPIRTLANGRYRAGAYRVAWDGRDEAGRAVAGGVYVYRLQADAFTQARTMVLMK